MTYVVGRLEDDGMVYLVDYKIVPGKHYHKLGVIDNAVVFTSSELASSIAKVFSMDVYFYSLGEN